MAATIAVTVECFGALQTQLGASRRVELAAPHTAAHLRDSLASAFPDAADLLRRSACARDDALLAGDAALVDGDQVALLPPVSGGQDDAAIPGRIVAAPLDLTALMRATESVEAGAIVVFGGTVRADNNARRVTAIDYSAYAPLAETRLAEIEQETLAFDGVFGVRVAHRVGRLALGETSVYVVVRAGHRDQAFAAGRYAIDTLKKRVPIWKNEHYADGSSDYVPGVALDADDAKTPDTR